MSRVPPKKKILSLLATDSLKIEIKFSSSALFHMKTRVFLKYFVRGCRYELAAKSLSLNKPFNVCRIVFSATSTVFTICTIAILTKTNNFTSHSFRAFKTVTVTLWSSKDDERRGLTRAITESRTTFTAFLYIALTSLLTRLLPTALQVADLQGTPVN